MFPKKKSEKPVKEEKPEIVIERTENLCECGDPVAADLGQTTVCKKHIRTS